MARHSTECPTGGDEPHRRECCGPAQERAAVERTCHECTSAGRWAILAPRRRCYMCRSAQKRSKAASGNFVRRPAFLSAMESTGTPMVMMRSSSRFNSRTFNLLRALPMSSGCKFLPWPNRLPTTVLWRNKCSFFADDMVVPGTSEQLFQSCSAATARHDNDATLCRRNGHRTGIFAGFSIFQLRGLCRAHKQPGLLQLRR